MRLLLLCAILGGMAIPGPGAIAAAPGVAATQAAAGAGTAVVLAIRPGTELDATARQLVARDLAESRSAGDTPLILTGSAPLGGASDRPALFVQLQSGRDCGSAGCATTIYLWRGGGWVRVLDGVGGKLTVMAHRTRGMADLVTDDTRYVWTGQAYRDSRPPPPPIDLRPRVRGRPAG